MQEFDTSPGATDTLQFGADVAADQLWFRQAGNHLEVSIIGTPDTATLENWYLGSEVCIEQFQTAAGQTLLDSQVQRLVDAMASFAPPAVGATVLPATHQALLPVIAAEWRG